MDDLDRIQILRDAATKVQEACATCDIRTAVVDFREAMDKAGVSATCLNREKAHTLSPFQMAVALILAEKDSVFFVTNGIETWVQKKEAP